MNQNLVDLQNLKKEFDGTPVLRGISLSIKRREFVTLLGPSGCGKTTLLRCIGGFEKPTSGEILYKGKNIIGLPPYKRAINTVFQRYALFPHLNVAQNVAFGPDLRKEDKKKTAEEVSRMLALVGLAGFEKRRISSLSGGQQQRVAIGRALVTRPALIMADEPTGNLDSKNSQEVLALLQTMSDRYQQTILMITHNKNHASAADRVFRMTDGVLKDLGVSSR